MLVGRWVAQVLYLCNFFKISAKLIQFFSLHKCIIIMSLVQVGELEVNEAKASEELSQLRNEVQ